MADMVMLAPGSNMTMGNDTMAMMGMNDTETAEDADMGSTLDDDDVMDVEDEEEDLRQVKRSKLK